MLLHPLHGLGYQLYSGIGSSINEWLTTIVIVATFLVVWWQRHACHVHGCHYRNKRWLPPRLAWHPHPVHRHPVCKIHHPDHPSNGGARIHPLGTLVGKDGLHRTVRPSG